MSMFDTDSTLTSPKRYRSVSQYSMQDTMVSSSPNISSNTSKSKRKDTLDQSIEINTEVITNQIKKCRIYCTPGELRLQKDITEIEQLDHISIEETESASSIIITFNYPSISSYDMTTNEYSADCEIPRIFMITISRFYPHTCPNIKCLQPQIMTSEYILPDGSIQHSALGDNWSALGSLWSIIEILTFIRTAYSGQEYPPFESTAQMSLNPHQEMTSFLTSVDDMSSLSPPRRPLGAFNGRHLLSQYELTGSPSQVADTQMFEGILARLPSTRPSSLFSRIPVAAIQAQDEMTSVDGRSVVSSDTYIYPHIGTVNSQQYHDIAQFSYDSSGDRFDEMDLQTAYDK